MPKLRKATLVMSDHHLGEGAPRLEDFPVANARAYLEMLRAHLEKIGPDAEYDHAILGDWLDYHSVQFDGRYGVVPTESAAIAKTLAILRAHPEYFSGLRKLAEEHPKLSFRIFFGNHDLDLEWENVQDMIRRALMPEGHGRRVTFHRELKVGETVLLTHGDQFDPFSANPPAGETFKEDVMISRTVMLAMLVLSILLAGTVSGLIFAWVPYTFGGVAVGVILSFFALFLTLRWIAGRLAFRWSRKETILNVPIASYMNAGLGVRLKKWFFPGIGRRIDHGDEWILGVAQKPYALPLLLPLVALEALGHKFFHAFRRPRETFSFRTMFDLIASTMHPDRIEKELNRFLATRPDVRHLIAGHTHDGKMVSVEVGDHTVIYYNSGTAIRQVRTFKPDVTARTRWPRIEVFFRRVAYHWTHAPFKAAFATLAYAVLPVTLLLMPRVAALSVMRWPIAALALFLLLWWQFAAEYKNGSFFRFTPPEVLEYDDGSVQVRILNYDHESRRFHLLTGEEAIWDQR